MEIAKKEKILILGASSWIGYYVWGSLRRKKIGGSIIGTYNSYQSLGNGEDVWRHFDYHEPEDILEFIKEYKPNIIINLLGGKDEFLADFHVSLVDTLRSKSTWYLFMSSSMVFDGKPDAPHQEDDIASAQSEYGLLKQACEQQIKRNLNSYCICRISATHGFAPNKISRTESLLKRLQAGEKIMVDKGVFQNRLDVSSVADVLTELVRHQPRGTFHIGAVDQSEEDIFLKKIASEFGYNPDQVVSVDSKPKYLTVVPRKIFDIVGNRYKQMEAETIEKIKDIPEFKKYRVNK